MWGIFQEEDRPVQVAPCDEEGYTTHLLLEDCICEPRFDKSVLVHQDVI